MFSQVVILWQVACLVSFCSISRAEVVKLGQGSHGIIENVDQIRLLYGMNQQKGLQESRFASIPIPPRSFNQTAGPNLIGNGTGTTSLPEHKNVLVKRVVCKDKTTWRPSYDGQDPCEGLENAPDYQPCFRCNMFTRDWFIDNRIRAPGIDECLFYTSGQSDNARAFAENWRATHNTRLWTIWEIWDPIYYNNDLDTTNRLRCINQPDRGTSVTNRLRRRYFEAMSDAMAYMCGGVVLVMDPNIAPGGTGYIRRTGIWGRVEQPRLRQPGIDNLGRQQKWRDLAGNLRVCSQIDAITSTRTPQTITRFWPRWWYRTPHPGEPNPAPSWPSPVPVRRRSADEDEVKRDPSLEDNTTFLEARRLDRREFDVSIYDDEDSGYYIEW